MASGDTQPNWVSAAPAAFDIVTCFYPEAQPQPDGSFKLRPALVLNVFKDRKTGAPFCEVAYGTKNLKLTHPLTHLDLVIQNAGHLHQFGLYRATRFNLAKENLLILPWTDEHFGCWSNRATPIIGSLTEDYIRDFAYRMALRQRQAQIDD